MTKLSSSTPDRQTDRPARGIALIVASGMCFSAMGLGVRLSKEMFRPDVIVFYRSLIQVLILLPWVTRFFEPGWTVGEKFRIHFGRGAFGILSMYFLYSALHRLPFSLVTPLTLTSILWATLFAWLFLKERVTYRQLVWAVVLVTGVMVSVLSSGHGSGGWHLSVTGVGAALLCGLSMGAALTALRKMRFTMGTREIVFFFGCCGMLLTLPFFLTSPQFPTDLTSSLHLLWIGGAASLAQLFMTAGFRYVSTFTATLAKHFETVLNVALGILVLSELPPFMFYVGLGLSLAGLAGLSLRASVTSLRS